MNDTTSALRRDIAQLIEHDLLSPITLRSELDAGCRFARREGVAAVNVRPCDLREAAELLSRSRTAACTVVAYPHGGATRALKVTEAREAIEDAQSALDSQGPPVELGMVVNIGRVRSGDWESVRDEIHAVLDVTHARGGLLKVIFETGYLAEEQIRRLCELCGELGVDFVETSTGYGPRGTSIEDVTLMRQHLPASVKIKASGGVRSLTDLQSLAQAGADRIGTSRTAEILGECSER
jgi:deoxyribose-phosphate aldolase